jgi:shikimate dehydrogenase
MKNGNEPTGRTRMVFILGDPVAHSLSPAMHNAAFRFLGLEAVYAPVQVPPCLVPVVVEALRADNILGANVTVPHKESVMRHLDEVEPAARRIQSVNTIYKRGKKLWGASTDGSGFLRSLGRSAARLKGGRALLVGAGGGSRAVAGALAMAGVRHLQVLDLDKKRVQSLVKLLRGVRSGFQVEGVSRSEAEKGLRDVGLVIQATPVGLHPGDPSPLSLKEARKGCLAVDLIYHRETAFLKEARLRRLLALDGLGMLLHQGALSFEKWTGRRAPLMVMERALRRALG